MRTNHEQQILAAESLSVAAGARSTGSVISTSAAAELVAPASKPVRLPQEIDHLE